MLLDPASAGHVVQRLQQSDFEQGKAHIVGKLRKMVADHVAAFTPETLLELVLTFARAQRIGPWGDLWNPQEVLHRSGFECLNDAESVNAVGANEDERPPTCCWGINKMAVT